MKKFMLPQALLDVVKFTVTPSSGRTVTLDGFTAPLGGVVDWGDGSVSPLVSSAALSHTYGSSAARQIALRGTVGGFWNTTASTGKNLVTSLDEISSDSLVTLQNAFRGCTILYNLPSALRIPNVVNFNYTFYQNKSIVSNLTPLWLTHASRQHASCFTNCFKSLFGQYNSGCSYRQYVSTVPSQTYFQRYGQSGCPAATYHAATSTTHYYMYIGHGGNIYNCPQAYVKPSDLATGCRLGGANIWGYPPDGHCRTSGCGHYVSTSARYSCSHFKTDCKTSGCTRVYQSGQSAYYRCTRSGGSCQETSCPYPYANETSYNNARANGWA